eukprot:jgi/Ulvmu1/511/UM001_0519.1
MSGRNRYLLAPWMPVDVRLPAVAGILGMGTYLYLERSGRLDEAQEWVGKLRADAEQNLDNARRTSSAWFSTELDKWLPRQGRQADKMQSPEAVNDITPDGPVEDGTQLSPSSNSNTKHEEGTAAESATIVDTKDVKKIDHLMQEALLGRTIPDPTDEAAAADTPEHTAQQAESDQPAPVQEPGPLQAIQDLATQLERAALATTSALLTGAQPPPEVTIEGSHAEFDGALATELQDHVLRTAGTLGIGADVSASSLLASAQRSGLGTHGTARSTAAQQALADVETLHGVLDQMGRHHGTAMAHAAAAAEFWRGQAEAGKGLAREVARGTQRVLGQQQAQHEADMKESARSQAQRLAERFSEELTAERKERHQALSELGQSVAQAREGLRQRAAELHQTDAAYVVTGAITAVRNAVAAGCPTERVVELLRSADGEDAVVHAARESLVATAAPRVPTVQELQARWPAVRRSVQIKASMRRDANPGILSTMLAGLASRVKVSEWATLRVAKGGQGRSLDAQLAAIDECVAEGQLADVAVLLDELQAFLHMDHVADSFSSAVKAKALVDQALELLQAHACAMGVHA